MRTRDVVCRTLPAAAKGGPLCSPYRPIARLRSSPVATGRPAVPHRPQGRRKPLERGRRLGMAPRAAMVPALARAGRRPEPPTVEGDLHALGQLDISRHLPCGPAVLGRVAEPALTEPIALVLDQAHAELDTPALAALLLALQPLARQLAHPTELRSEPHAAASTLPPPARAPMRSVHQLLRLAAEEDRAGATGGWLLGYLEEVASRPRGAAVPEA